ncbi:MAG TPA: alpha/beta hydrolase-fold protein [Bacillota bacterium]|nr:alpha/beta hydrolase-fold protein [Bacillota bacterium]
MQRRGKMIEKGIISRFLNETLTLKIYKPETFSPLYKYHLCIMQDGDDYYQLGRVATLSDRLHASGAIENTVFVGIHYNDKYDRREKYHPEGKQHEAYKKFLVHEVIPFLDHLLPTYHMSQSRALMGDSLAGTLGLMCALAYPHTFGKVIMQSPYVNDTVLEAVQTVDKAAAIDVYQTIGTNETAVNTTKDGQVNFLQPNRKLAERLRNKGINLIYQEIIGGEHTWKYWQQDLPNALTTLFE